MIIKILAIVFYDLYIKTCPEFHFSTRSCEVRLIHIQSLSMSLPPESLSYSSTCRARGEGGAGGGGFTPPPPHTHFFENYIELLRKRCFQPPHFESLASPPPSPLPPHFQSSSAGPDLIWWKSLSATLEVPSRLARVTCWIASSLIKFIDASVVSELLSGVLGLSEEGLDTCWTLSSELFDDFDGMHKTFA